jgi:hypothetical protein
MRRLATALCIFGLVLAVSAAIKMRSPYSAAPASAAAPIVSAASSKAAAAVVGAAGQREATEELDALLDVLPDAEFVAEQAEQAEPAEGAELSQLHLLASRIEEQAYAGGELTAQAQRNVARMIESERAAEILVAIDLLKHFPQAAASFKDDVALAICRWQSRPDDFELIRSKFERAARTLGYPSLARCEG